MSIEDQIRATVRDEVEAAVRVLAIGGEYVTQSNAPIGRRAFLHAARAGKFPARKVGRRVVAFRSDFDRWLATFPAAMRRSTPTDTATAEDELLAKLGLERRAS